MNNDRRKTLLYASLLIIAIFGYSYSQGWIRLSSLAPSSQIFDSSSTLTYTKAQQCFGSIFGGVSLPPWCTSLGTTSSTNKFNINSQGQTFSSPAASIVADSDQNRWCITAAITSACGWAGVQLGVGYNTYGITGSTGYPWRLLGQDPVFLKYFSETAPSNNPITLNAGNGQAFNVYRFQFSIILRIYGDSIQAQTVCYENIAGDQCTGAEVQALNQALSFVNTNDKISGTVLVDITVPDPFFGASPNDKWGFLGSWIGGTTANTGCVVSNLSGNGGSASVTPCQGHTIIPNNLAAYSPATNTPTLDQYKALSTPPLNLSPTAQLAFSINNIGPTYTASSPVNGPSSPVDCLTVPGPAPAPGQTTVGSLNGCSISYSGGIQVEIPIISDVAGFSPSLQKQSGIVTNSSASGPNYTPGTTNFQIHVVDSWFGLPLTGMQVGINSGSSCATTSGYSTDANGNVIIPNEPSGSYVVCASGGSGGLSLIIVNLTLQYGQNSCVITSPPQTGCTIVLQPTFIAALTLFGVSLGVFGIILIFAFFIISLLTGSSILAIFTRRRKR